MAVHIRQSVHLHYTYVNKFSHSSYVQHNQMRVHIQNAPLDMCSRSERDNCAANRFGAAHVQHGRIGILWRVNLLNI